MLTARYEPAADALNAYITAARDSKRRERILEADAIFRRAEARLIQTARAAAVRLAAYPDNLTLKNRISVATSNHNELLEYNETFWRMMNDKFPSDADIALKYGDILYRRERYQEMLDVYSPLLNGGLSKSDRVVLFHRSAIARDSLGAYGAATFDAESALVLDNRNEAVIRLLANLYRKQNRKDKLRELLPQWIALYKNKLPDEYPADLQAIRKYAAESD